MRPPVWALLLLLPLLWVPGTRAQDDFDLSDALGGDDPKPTARLPKKPVPGDDLNLEDALNGGGHNDPPPPDPPKPRPNPNPKPHQPGTSGSFSDSDLVDGNVGGGGGGAGGPGSNRKDDGETQADSPGVISGIVGAVLVAVGGAISSAIAYQRKKWCFQQDDPEGINMDAQRPGPVQQTLLEK